MGRGSEGNEAWRYAHPRNEVEDIMSCMTCKLVDHLRTAAKASEPLSAAHERRLGILVGMVAAMSLDLDKAGIETCHECGVLLLYLYKGMSTVFDGKEEKH